MRGNDGVSGACGLRLRSGLVCVLAFMLGKTTLTFAANGGYFGVQLLFQLFCWVVQIHGF